MAASASQDQTPQAEYNRRLDRVRATHARLKAQDARLSFARFALLFGGTLFAVWLVVSKTHSIYWIAAPIVLFVTLATIHSRVAGQLENCRRAAAFYERGLARLDNRWIGRGQKGERFLDNAQPYARDLDIFGEGSLFELLSTARTRAGEETLARWLLSPAAPEEIVSRQAAIGDLCQRLALREELAVLSEEIEAAVRPDALIAWAEADRQAGATYLRILLPVLAVFWVLGLAAWAVWGLWYLAAGITLLNALVANGLRHRVSDNISTTEAALRDLPLLSQVLQRVEREPFSSPRLVALQNSLRKGGESASQSIARLARRAESLASRRNLMVKGIDRFVFWTLQFTLALEAWQKRFGPEVRGWLATLGEIEALSDLAGYAYEHPADVFPEFTGETPCFHATGLAHPLLPEDRAIRNDLALGEALRLVIISGPNMAGKSTFVRAVGVNAVLAQCGAPVRARKLQMSPLAVAASVCVLDSLQGGVSRFYAEITRLKLIMDMAERPIPVLFLLDELLSGTNSHDRRVGAEAVVRGLLQRNAVGLLTTHDLALAEIAAPLGSRAVNAHFTDRLDGTELRFDYRLTPGVVQTSNALALMRSIGLDV